MDVQPPEPTLVESSERTVIETPARTLLETPELTIVETPELTIVETLARTVAESPEPDLMESTSSSIIPISLLAYVRLIRRPASYDFDDEISMSPSAACPSASDWPRWISDDRVSNGSLI